MKKLSVKTKILVATLLVSIVGLGLGYALTLWTHTIPYSIAPSPLTVYSVMENGQPMIMGTQMITSYNLGSIVDTGQSEQKLNQATSYTWTYLVYNTGSSGSISLGVSESGKSSEVITSWQIGAVQTSSLPSSSISGSAITFSAWTPTTTLPSTNWVVVQLTLTLTTLAGTGSYTFSFTT